MVSARTIGIFLIAAGAILFTVAMERYNSAVTTAKAIADQIEGMEFESVGMPLVSSVCGLAAIVLLVAGAKVLFDSRHLDKPKNPAEDGLLS